MITYHHIGGRNGTYPLPLADSILLRDFHLALYDADENCFEQMKKVEQEGWGKVSVYPYCIGKKTGRALFNLNFHPTTNSLYPFNEEYATYGFVRDFRYGEYIFGEACKHIESIELNLLSLEEALKRSQNVGLDFLSLDVQGAEYDILEGAKDFLAKNCIGIQLEVEFVKLYQDQKTFFDIHSLLESMGFELIDLGSFGRCAPISLPLGFRGSEQPLYAEALYLKKVDVLAKDKNLDGLYKGALFSLLYKKVGLCVKFLTKAIEMNGREHDPVPLYKKCLIEIWDLYERFKNYRLPSISQLFSNKMFREYYQQKNTTNLKDEIKETLRNQITDILPTITELHKSADSQLEELLKKYGLCDVAATIKTNRFFEAKCFLDLANELELVKKEVNEILLFKPASNCNPPYNPLPQTP
ncbi:FkbM family methyltransferase [Coxiella burnetii]|nr:FkbM family methyltransferase [Coxiella burnetii]